VTDHMRCGQRLLADRLFKVVAIQLLRWLLGRPSAGSWHTPRLRRRHIGSASGTCTGPAVDGARLS